MEPNRVGIEINREPNETWESLVIRYSQPRNLVVPCITMYNNLVASGVEEAYAALQSLAEHACTDIIIDEQHLCRRKITLN